MYGPGASNRMFNPDPLPGPTYREAHADPWWSCTHCPHLASAHTSGHADACTACSCPFFDPGLGVAGGPQVWVRLAVAW